MPYEAPRILWESFEAALYAAQRNFIRSLAEEVLDVPAAELLHAFNKDTLKVELYDTDEQRECYSFVTCKDQPDLVTRCRRPVLPGNEYCATHKHARSTVQLKVEPPILWRPLRVPAELPALWVDDAGNVRNVQKIICGKYNKDTGELLFYDMEG